MPTPLLDALRKRSGKAFYRGHMPGHKGKRLPYMSENAATRLDFTELSDTGNLYTGKGVIAEAEALAAEAYGAEYCAFLTGGATLGILAALKAAVSAGSKILVDRGCHTSVYNAMGLNDLRPVYLYSDTLPTFGVTSAVSAEAVRLALELERGVKAVVITSPTYYGVVSDIAAIAKVCRERDVKLIVDEAHGAHLPFLDGFGGCAVALGADFSIMSAHKTLPAPGQSAYLFWRDTDPRSVRRALSVLGTSSPSYYLMAALDGVREYMQGEGRREYARAAKRAALMRKHINHGMFRAMTEQNTSQRLDPLRLTVCTGNGLRDLERLESIFGVVPEMADSYNVVFILNGMDSDADFDRLETALTALERLGGRGQLLEPPQLDTTRAQMVLTPRRVLVAEADYLPLDRAVGCVAARHIAPYPPGIPLIAAGERIEEKHLANLRKRGYNTDYDVAVVKSDV